MAYLKMAPRWLMVKATARSSKVVQRMVMRKRKSMLPRWSPLSRFLRMW